MSILMRSFMLFTLVVVMVQGDDLLTEDSSLHYTFDHAYGYDDHHSPYHGYKHKYGHHHTDVGYAEGHHHAYGHHAEHGYNQAPVYGHHPHYDIPTPPHHHYHHGFVPHPHDHVEGRAYGHDLVGPFYHHTGPFGPFGFYANFYHD